MFCFQCQETRKNQGCPVKGVCGKPEETADLQDLLIYVYKGISIYGEKLKEMGMLDKNAVSYARPFLPRSPMLPGTMMSSSSGSRKA